MEVPSFIRPLIQSIMYGVQVKKLSLDSALERSKGLKEYAGNTDEAWAFAKSVASLNLEITKEFQSGGQYTWPEADQ